MEIKPYFANTTRRWAFFVLLALAAVFLVTHTINTVKESESRAAQMRWQYLEKQRQIIKSEVISFTELIEHEMDKVFQEAKTQVKVRVSAAHAVAQNLYSQNIGDRTKKEIQKLIIESLRPIRLDQEGGYYFISDFNGEIKLFADRPDQENISLISRQDKRGQYVLKDMIKLVQSNEEGFYSYHWSKPGQQGDDFEKIAFVKQFKPFDWLIGTGVYPDDLESSMQRTISQYGKTRRFGPNGGGYVFVYELLDIQGGKNFARVYTNPNLPNDTGKMISDDYKDAKGKPFRKEFLKGIREHGECFVDYWYKKIDNPKPSPKTSFFKLAGNGRFVVAAGIYLDDVEDQISVMQADLKKQLWQGYLVITAIFIAAVFVFFLIAKHLNKKLENDFQIFAEFFKLAANSSLSIDREKVKFFEFDRLAEFANRMLAQKAMAESKLKGAQVRLTQAQEMANVGHYIFDVKKDSWTSSAELNNIFGIDDNSNKNTAAWLQIIHPDYQEKMSVYLKDHILNQHQKFDMEYKIINQRSGRERWVHGLGDLNLDKDRQSSEMFGTIQDITERKQIEEALRKSQGRLRGIVDSMADWIWEVDADGRYLYCSKKVEKILGYSPEEMIGKTPFDFMVTDEVEKIRGVFNKNIVQKKPIKDLENWNICKDGSKICLLTNGVPILNENGELLGFRGVDKDITQGKQADKKRKELEAQLSQNQKMEAIGTLAGGIAHDFNNILSGILAYSQLANTHIKTPEKATRHIEQIVIGAKRAADLTKQILTLSRQGEYQKQPFRIYLEIKEALKLLRSSIPSTIEIKTRLDSRKMVLADPIKIHQVVMNLCTNAYHAMRKTGGELTVSLTDADVFDPHFSKDEKWIPGEYIKLEVSDTGHGMDKKTLEKAFEPYFTTKEKGDGTGFGLALVQAIVEEHDAYLEVISEPGKGTCFYIYFPIVLEEIKKRTPKIEKEHQLTGNEKIMVVDDEGSIRDSCKEYLEDNGYEVQTFSNGIEALERFKTRPFQFDLVITDMTMPGLTGDKLAREILKIQPAIPIVLCTGFNENISQAGAVELGVRQILQKPIMDYDLLLLIRSFFDS